MRTIDDNRWQALEKRICSAVGVAWLSIGHCDVFLCLHIFEKFCTISKLMVLHWIRQVRSQNFSTVPKIFLSSRRKSHLKREFQFEFDLIHPWCSWNRLVVLMVRLLACGSDWIGFIWCVEIKDNCGCT